MGWKKVLYEDQGVPDDYVDKKFLDEMKKNLYTRTYDFWSVVNESSIVMQQIYSLWLFVMVYIYMKNSLVMPQSVFVISFVVTVIGYVVNFVLLQNLSTKTKWINDIKTTSLFLAFGFSLSPIFMTLTLTISTDTVYAMTFFMLLANLVFHDYGADTAVVSQALSLNAGIFASICLASRLPTTWHAFAMTTFAFELFALWPILRKNLKLFSPRSQLILTFLFGAVVMVIVATVSATAFILLFFLHVFVMFLCPAWLIQLQPYKNNIHGPWDEAVIKQ